MPRLRSRPATLASAFVLLLASAAAAQAQTTPTPAPTTAPTTPTTAAPGPPTTCFLLCAPPSTNAPTTTPHGPSKLPSTTAPASPSTTSPSPPSEGQPPPGTPRIIPPDAQREIDSVRRTGPNNTDAWLAALPGLATELGMTQTDAAITGGGHFPVAGPTTWVDDWHYPRFVPTFHLHQGVDMFAASGTPIRAPFDGTLRYSDGAVGGLAAYVTQSDGTFAYMAHMSAYAPGKATGQPVRQGEVVGFVGDTGDARGGAPHCHFELHPLGGEAVPPKPSVDAWLAEATAAAPALIASIRQARNPSAPGAAAGASVTAVPEATTLPLAATVAVDPTAALWAAASNPAIGTIDLASSLVASAADGIDWPEPPPG